MWCGGRLEGEILTAAEKASIIVCKAASGLFPLSPFSLLALLSLLGFLCPPDQADLTGLFRSRRVDHCGDTSGERLQKL